MWGSSRPKQGRHRTVPNVPEQIAEEIEEIEQEGENPAAASGFSALSYDIMIVT